MRRRTTWHSAAYKSRPDRVASSLTRTLFVVENKEQDPYPADYADLGVDLLSVSFSGAKLTDVYRATVGRHL